MGIGGVFAWYWGLLLVVFGLFCVWIGATVSTPVKQRNEAWVKASGSLTEKRVREIVREEIEKALAEKQEKSTRLR